MRRSIDKHFSKVAEKASAVAGNPIAFAIAGMVIVLWALAGFLFQFSEMWQLVINTGTSITTFLLVFLIQNSQNRETRAVQLKLDELIRATKGAHNTMISLERLTDEELHALFKQYENMANVARNREKGGRNTPHAEISEKQANGR